MKFPPTPDASERRWILPVIIVSQFAGTSLWFASNAVLPDLQRALGIGANAVGSTTSAVQFGFILGTLFFAAFTIPDRFSPRKLFFLCSTLGAVCNLAIVFLGTTLPALLALRFLTGICLTGIYPVGMKIASGWYRQGLGNALGFLVGALVLGTAFPHLLRGLSVQVAWEGVLYAVSALAFAGGVLMLVLVPDGPYLVQGAPLTMKALPLIFRSPGLRAAAFGYFGHMWELYTFYAFVPLLLAAYFKTHAAGEAVEISRWSFCIIAAGSIGCAGGGLLSRRFGSPRVAWAQLAASGLLCLCSPFVFTAPVGMFLLILLLWGMTVVGDSPQFSALVARHAPKEFVGSALTITNCIGFAITIASIQCIAFLSTALQPQYLFLFLAPGPLIGLFVLSPLTVSSKVE